MDDNQIQYRLNQIFSTLFDIKVDLINSESSPNNVPGWDSLKHIEMVIRIEQEFGIQFKPTEIPLLNTFQNIHEILTGKLKNLQV